MARSSQEILLQILVRPEWRGDEGLQRVLTALRRLGIEASASGRASVSARVAARTFAKLFGQSVPREGASPSAGPSSGWGPLPVPATLESMVQSITVAPRHSYFSKGSGDTGGSE